MTRGCPHVNEPYLCELAAGHDGPHRVRYRGQADRTWTDADTDYIEDT